MNFKFRSILLFLKICIKLILNRPFGNIIFDVSARYEDGARQDLRRLEKITLKENKARLDVTFLHNCKSFGVTPKFINFQCGQANSFDEKFIKKRLLKSAMYKREKELKNLNNELIKLKSQLQLTLSAMDYYVVLKAIRNNVLKHEKTIILTHSKKLSNLTGNKCIPFTAAETITNLSNYNLTTYEEEILKYGLKHAVPPLSVNKTEILATFDIMHRVLMKDIKDVKDKGKLKSEISYIANNYVNNYKPTKSTLKKHRILKQLRNNNDIVIVKPDKGSGVVILSKIDYTKVCSKTIGTLCRFVHNFANLYSI